MPPKNRDIPLPKYMTPVRRRDHVAYKYQRDVPKAIQPLLNRKRWDLSLGGDLVKATARCAAYTEEHNRILAELATEEDRQAYRMTKVSTSAARLAEYLATKGQPGNFVSFDGNSIGISADPERLEGVIIEGGERKNQELWRTTEDLLSRAEKMTNQQAIKTLATFAAYAFGDRSHMDKIADNDPFGEKLADLMDPQRPSDLTAGAIFDALQAALNARLAELVGQSKESDEYRLSALRERYFKLNNSSAATKRSYTGKIDKLIANLGADLPLHQITPDKLRAHRDSLLEDMKPDSVAQYFAPVKAIMRWAISEELVPGFDAMPTDKVKMPRNDTPVEESRWQRFDDNEIKQVWGLVQKAWGPESKYTPERQEAFQWAFRVALYTAARPVEIFRMKPENVTPDFINVTETKTRISRKLPLTKHLDGFHEFMQNGGWKLGKTKPESVAGTMSDSFTKTIRAAGFTNDRQVLYSTKDTLVDRLQRANCTDDVIRGITGHVSGQGQLRNYKTRLNDTPEGLEMLRNALDAVVYW